MAELLGPQKPGEHDETNGLSADADHQASGRGGIQPYGRELARQQIDKGSKVGHSMLMPAKTSTVRGRSSVIEAPVRCDRGQMFGYHYRASTVVVCSRMSERASTTISSVVDSSFDRKPASFRTQSWQSATNVKNRIVAAAAPQHGPGWAAGFRRPR